MEIKRMTDKKLAKEIFFARMAQVNTDQATMLWLDALLNEHVSRRNESEANA